MRESLVRNVFRNSIDSQPAAAPRPPFGTAPANRPAARPPVGALHAGSAGSAPRPPQRVVADRCRQSSSGGRRGPLLSLSRPTHLVMATPSSWWCRGDRLAPGTKYLHRGAAAAAFAAAGAAAAGVCAAGRCSPLLAPLPRAACCSLISPLLLVLLVVLVLLLRSSSSFSCSCSFSSSCSSSSSSSCSSARPIFERGLRSRSTL